MGTTPKQGTLVEIFGDPYRIAGDAASDQVASIARCVDERMARTAALNPGAGKLSVAILVAMELADELGAAQQERTELLHQAQDNLERLTRLVEQRAETVNMMPAPAPRVPAGVLTPAARHTGTLPEPRAERVPCRG